VAQKRQNYVCLCADIYHFSKGNCDKAYYENMRIFQRKWKRQLPYALENQTVSLRVEMSNALGLFIQSLRHGFTVRDALAHAVEINGVKVIFLFPVFTILKICKRITREIYRVIVPEKIKNAIRNKRHQT
jgi:hypothetical protein